MTNVTCRLTAKTEVSSVSIARNRVSGYFAFYVQNIERATNKQNWTACADFPNVVAAGRCYTNAASDAMFRRPACLCLCFALWIMTQQNATFLGVAHPSGGLWPPNSNSAEIFVHCTYPQVSSSYVYSFGSYRVETQTNKQTTLKTSNVLRYATMLGTK